MNEQQTAEWFADRCGNVTASRIADVTAKTKTGYGAGRANYMTQLMIERLTNTVEPSFTNAAMEWGTATEPFAREAYEVKTGELVIETGFHPHPTIERSGASPDGLVGDTGLLEIKCPNSATHCKTLLGGKIDKKYLLQMQWQMACTEREYCDFVSFDPRMPENLEYFSQRVERDDELIAEISAEVEKFLAELSDMVSKLDNLRAA